MTDLSTTEKLLEELAALSFMSYQEHWRPEHVPRAKRAMEVAYNCITRQQKELSDR